ncbi:response regulator [Polyangium jinanense]|uniref:Response regulator n=1 Tax=Polyangium jinanense TaxID=2829994 RepID=A0A9X4AZ11_9BACT|nr:response regulator [Polyangium jinanense]MDC3961429.1 response regulator [Polyangium jinanense]MDC3987860.1 response regulator [Polyangium jinanense]
MAKLLIVDDDDETRLWMAAALADVGHEVRTSPSGRDAVRVVSTWQPDVAILDVLMSEMDGFAVNRVLRSHGIPTIFVTVVKREAEAILQGVSGYVEKPVTAAELRAVVERVLGGATGGAILLVEDDSFLRSVYRSVLAPKFQVLEAENGRDALSMLETHPVALVITDIHMPVMNGVELVRAIRNDARTRDLPIVVQSCDTSAVRSPVWSGLHVSRVMRKEDFIGWLIGQIEEQLSTLSVKSA